MGRIENITSRQNKTVSLLSALDLKKARDKEELFKIDGVKLVCEAYKNGADIVCCALREDEAENVADKARSLYGVDIFSLDCKIITVPSSVFERLTDEKAPEGIVCAVRYMKDMHRSITHKEICADLHERILLLESVRDPSNVGAIIRSAAAFGVDRIIMSSDCADIYNRKTLRASMGNLFLMRIDTVDSIQSAIAALRNIGMHVYAAALDSESVKLGSSSLKKPCCAVIGNEGHGLSREVIDACDGTLYIPMSDGVESLNASVAASVIMWELFGRENKSV